MMSGEKRTREGSVVKREAILSVARMLFLREGFDRTSMDAISSAANVSKRTVYDYFGDKATLLDAVLEAAAEATLAALRETLDHHLSDEVSIPDEQALERALTAFAIDLSTVVIGSSDYATIFALKSGRRAEISPLDSDRYSINAPEEAIAARLARFHSLGLLDVPDAREAAEHFNALTMLLAYSNQHDPTQADPERIRQSITGGVRAFMRAYGNAGKKQSKNNGRSGQEQEVFP